MIRICRNIPSIISNFDREEVEVETVGELLAVPWVSEFKTSNWARFSIAPCSGFCVLIAEFLDGTYRLIGTIMNQDDVELPRWQPRTSGE